MEVIVKKNWLVVGIEQDVIDAIKHRAKDFECTIPDILAKDYMDKPPKNNKWVIEQVDPGLVDEIRAASKGSVIGYLKRCHVFYNRYRDTIKDLRKVREFFDSLD
jgi:hypothetical protein